MPERLQSELSTLPQHGFFVEFLLAECEQVLQKPTKQYDDMLLVSHDEVEGSFGTALT